MIEEPPVVAQPLMSSSRPVLHHGPPYLLFTFYKYFNLRFRHDVLLSWTMSCLRWSVTFPRGCEQCSQGLTTLSTAIQLSLNMISRMIRPYQGVLPRLWWPHSNAHRWVRDLKVTVKQVRWEWASSMHFQVCRARRSWIMEWESWLECSLCNCKI